MFYKLKNKVKIFYVNLKNLFVWVPIFWQNPDLYAPNMHKADFRKLTEWVPTLLKDRDWDFGFMLEMEQQKLKDVIRWYKENDYGHHVDGWHDYRTLKWAYNCLEIILDSSWWTINYPDDKKDNWLNLPKEEVDSYYEIKPYINTRNVIRFKPWLHNKKYNEVLERILKNPAPYDKIDLREEKAWKLYHKIREQYMRDWWD